MSEPTRFGDGRVLVIDRRHIGGEGHGREAELIRGNGHGARTRRRRALRREPPPEQAPPRGSGPAMGREPALSRLGARAHDLAGDETAVPTNRRSRGASAKEGLGIPRGCHRLRRGAGAISPHGRTRGDPGLGGVPPVEPRGGLHGAPGLAVLSRGVRRAGCPGDGAGRPGLCRTLHSRASSPLAP